jgi:hypothetical protein
MNIAAGTQIQLINSGRAQSTYLGKRRLSIADPLGS